MPGSDTNSYSVFRERKSLKVLFLVFLGLVLLGLFYIFKPYLWVFLFATIVYIGVVPVYDFLLAKIKSESIAMAVVGTGVFLVIVFPAIFILIYIGDQSYQLYSYVMDQVQNGQLAAFRDLPPVDYLVTYFNIDEQALLQKTTVFIEKSAGMLFTSVTSLISFPITFVANLFLMVLILLLFLKEGTGLEEKLYHVLPFPDDIERKVVERLKVVIKILLAGNLFIMTVQGFFLGLGLYISGFSAPLLWAIAGAIVSLIPVIGTGFIWIPASLYLVFSGDYAWALFLAIWSYGWYLFFENLVKPWAFGDRLNFNPLVFFFLLLGSIQGFGLAGVIIGPLLLTLFFSLWEIYRIVQALDEDYGDVEAVPGNSDNSR